MPVIRAFPDAVTTVDSSEQYALGTEWYMDAGEAEALDSTVQGPQRWIYVKADAAFAEGNVIGIKDGTADYEGVLMPANAPLGRLLGVAQHAIGSGKYGWILQKGFGEVIADAGGITANQALITGDNAGKADSSSTQMDATFGFATEAAAEDALATCFINV